MIIILVFISLLASCGGSRQNRHIEKKTRSRGSSIDEIRRQEAKLSDIPIPISSQPLSEYCTQSATPDEVMLGYHCSLQIDELTQFFTQEMERFGWRYGAQFKGHEQLLNFEKPNRVCSISLRPKNQKTDVVIFMGKRRKEV